MPDKTELQKSLEYQCHEYRDQIDEKTFLGNTFEGGSGYIKASNLFKHGRENTLDYKRRIERSYFQNFCAPLIGVIAGFLMGQAINRKNDFNNQDAFDAFLQDINGKGDNISVFMTSLIGWCAAQGEAYIVVDRPIGEAETKADERLASIMTTAKRIAWSDLLDWEEGENEEFNWVKIRDEEIKARTFDQPEKNMKQYKVITKSDWKIYEIEDGHEPALVSEGENPIGKVNVFCLEWPGGSMIKDAARVNRSVYNWCSLLDENLYKQTFAQLCMAGDPPDEVLMGTSTALTYEAGTPAPSFIAPPSTPCDVLRANIDAGKKAIKEMILFRAEEGIMDQSGISKSYDFAQLNKTLLAAARMLENCEEKIMRLYALWANEPVAGITVQYPTSYDLRDLEKLVDEAIKTQSISMGKEFDRYLKKKISRGYVDARDSEDQAKIDEEIDSGETEIKPLPPIVFGNK